MFQNTLESVQELLSVLESQLLVGTTTEQSKTLADISKVISIQTEVRRLATMMGQGETL